MPQWLHDRAKHIMRDNPQMEQSTAFAIATQQSHATGHTPKGYGTPTGKAVAKKKYDEPGEMKQTADPSHKSKTASLAFWKGFADELEKIAITTPRTITGLAKPKLPKMGATSVPRDTPPFQPMRDPLSSSKTTPPPPVTAG